MAKDLQHSASTAKHNGCPTLALFDEIDGDFVLIINSGTYVQAPMARRGKELYAKLGIGFIRLKAHGQTSKAKVFWKEMLTIKEWSNGYHGLELVQ